MNVGLCHWDNGLIDKQFGEFFDLLLIRLCENSWGPKGFEDLKPIKSPYRFVLKPSPNLSIDRNCNHKITFPPDNDKNGLNKYRQATFTLK